MGLCPEHIAGRDIDDLFSYSTIKYVQIRDRRLGFAKLLLTLGVMGYVGLYELWYQGLYLERSPLTGTCRFTLQQPTVHSCDPTDPGCLNDYGDPKAASYCAQSPLPYAGRKRECEFYENVGAQHQGTSSLLVATRITTLEQVLVCNASHGPDTCPVVYEQTSNTSRYVMAAERFTVLVDHSVLATGISHLKGRSSDLKGRLFVKKASSLCEKYGGSKDMRGLTRTSAAPCYVKPNATSRGLDFFSLDVLLRADDVSLDEINYGGETFRETGASLILEIHYENFRGWPGLGEIYYSYTPMVVAGSSYKIYDAVYETYRTSRHLLNQHGIYVEAVQGGELRGFSFNALLIQLTTSLTLFATAKVLTDFLAVYLLPDRRHYAGYMYEQTPDFGDLRHAQEERERRLLGNIQASALHLGDADAAPDHTRRSADGAITDWHDA